MLVTVSIAGSIAGAARAAERGPVTNLPLPRFVSLKAAESNVRRGPSLAHRIDWVYRMRDVPLQITAEYGNWRRVRDVDGLGGWVHYALLSGARTVLFTSGDVPLLAGPVPDAPARAVAQRGVVARLDECARDFCLVRAGGYRGWVPKTALWGVDAAELLK